MASKSKSRGSSKKSSPVSKPSKASRAVAIVAKPKAKPVAGKKTPAKPQSKSAPKKLVPKTGKAASVAAKGSAKLGKLQAPKAGKSSGKTAVLAKSPKKGPPIKSTKASKPVPAKPKAKPTVKVAAKVAPKSPVKKTVLTAKSAAVARKAPIKSAPVPKVVASRNVASHKAPPPTAKPLVLPSKVAPKLPAKPVKSVRIVAPAISAKTGSAPKASPVPEKESRKPKLDLFVGTFFQEVPVGSAGVRKSRVPQAAVLPVRKPKGEESHDELIARIEKELLTVRMAGKKIHRVQVCTKCCINPVDPSFMVDRDTGYCAECAVVLGLGHTREARQQNFHPSLMKSGNEEVPEPT